MIGKSESLIEKLEQKAKTTYDIHHLWNDYFSPEVRDMLFEKWVKLDDVLKILEDYTPMEDLMNCMVKKVTKRKDGKIIIYLADLVGQEYGRLMLEDDFGLDLKSTENIALQKYSSKKEQGFVVVEKQKLHELYMQIRKRHKFESQHTQLDRESNYFVSKPQQEFLDFLTWLDKKFAELGLDTKKESAK